MKLHRGIPYLPALIAHPGFRTSAALQQAVSITTEEKKKKTWEVVRSSMQGWSVWPPEVHQVSWTPQLPPGSGQTPETSLLPQAETFFEDKSQPPPPQLLWRKLKFCLCLNWNEKLSSAVRIHTITQGANAFQLYQSVNFYPLSFCRASSFTPSLEGTNRLNCSEQAHQDPHSHTFSRRTQELYLSPALGTQVCLGHGTGVVVPRSISHGPTSLTGEPWTRAMAWISESPFR